MLSDYLSVLQRSVAKTSLVVQHAARVDERHAAVDANDLIKDSCQLKRCATNTAADVYCSLRSVDLQSQDINLCVY